MTSPPWKVGELAQRTGLSVRALHHYDAIGLLTPSLRTPAGHRLYARADVERLQQIQSLRAMGLALDEVRRLLDGAGVVPRRVIAMQLQRLRAQIAVQTRLAERLTTLASYLDTAESASLEDLCHIIEDMTAMEQLSRHFTPEQLTVLEQQRTGVGPERAHEIRAAWNEIIPQVRHAMQQHVDPTTPEVLVLARRWKGLVDEMTAGDPAIASAARTMYEQNGPALQEKLGEVPTAEMFAYISRAYAAL